MNIAIFAGLFVIIILTVWYRINNRRTSKETAAANSTFAIGGGSVLYRYFCERRKFSFSN
jgi:hypothetical protein